MTYFFKKLSTASGECVLFDPGKATIYFGEGCDRVNALDLSWGREHVQNIAFGSWLWSVRPPSQLLFEISRRFPYVMLQCEQFGHVILGILHRLTYENTGHKATTYR